MFQINEKESEIRVREENNRTEKALVSQELRHRATIEEKIRTRTAKVKQLSSNKINLELERSRCESRVKKELERCMTQQNYLLNSYCQLEEKFLVKTKKTIAKISAWLKVTDAEDSLSNSSQELTQAQELLQAHSERVQRQREHAKELLEKAKNACGLTTNELPPKYKQKFKK